MGIRWWKIKGGDKHTRQEALRVQWTFDGEVKIIVG